MTEFPSFPKIHAIGSRYIDGIFDGIVEVTEKVDGPKRSSARPSNALARY